jgi:hypothetical protein
VPRGRDTVAIGLCFELLLQFERNMADLQRALRRLVVQAATENRARIQAHASMDAWALGVMAFELLSGEMVFDPSKMSIDDVRSPAVLQVACYDSPRFFFGEVLIIPYRSFLSERAEDSSTLLKQLHHSVSRASLW